MNQLAVSVPGLRSWLVVAAVITSAALARPHSHCHGAAPKKHHPAKQVERPKAHLPELGSCRASATPVLSAFLQYRAARDERTYDQFQLELDRQCAFVRERAPSIVAPPVTAFDQLDPAQVRGIACDRVALHDRIGLTWDGALWLPQNLK